MYSFRYGNNLVNTKFYFLLATKTLYNVKMDPINKTLKTKQKKKKNLWTIKGTLEISLQFQKLTNNSTASFIITFGLQCIIDEMIHVHDTHPQCTDWSLTENMNKSIIGRTLGKTIFNEDIFSKCNTYISKVLDKSSSTLLTFGLKIKE